MASLVVRAPLDRPRPHRQQVVSRQVVEIDVLVRVVLPRYAIAAKISCAVVDNAGVVSCFIDSALNYRRSATAHSSSCSSSTAPTRRITAAGFGKIPTTFDRRLISLFNRSSGFVLCNWRWCSTGRCRYAEMSSAASSSSVAARGNRGRRPSATLRNCDSAEA
jgi:hypothetical protein